MASEHQWRTVLPPTLSFCSSAVQVQPSRADKANAIFIFLSYPVWMNECEVSRWLKDTAVRASTKNCNRVPGKKRSNHQFYYYYSATIKRKMAKVTARWTRLMATCLITLPASAVELEMPACVRFFPDIRGDQLTLEPCIVHNSSTNVTDRNMHSAKIR